MRILLVNPFPPGRPAVSSWPHLGLTLLATAAAARGHAARVVDYAYAPRSRPLADELGRFVPDVVGLSLYTAHMAAAREAVREIRARTAAVLAVGGPHATLYADELAAEDLADWIFRGECDTVFPEMAGRLGRRRPAEIVTASPPEPAEIGWPDFGLAEAGSGLASYPLQLSRGCPFACSFCSVKLLSTRRIRFRDPEAGLREIDGLAGRFPRLREVRIVDDCPTYELDRFKEFLRAYARSGPGYPLHVDNLRADRLDPETLDLFRAIGVDHLCLGVESGSPRVFAAIHKGETLEEIDAAARAIKAKGLRLYLCFIIGLPGATAEDEDASVRLARRLRPNWIYWNQFQPHKGTEARSWFEAHGRILEEEGRTSLLGLDLEATAAPCETPGYPAAERVRAQLRAALRTGAYWLHPRFYPRYARLIARRGLWRPFLAGFPAAVRINGEMLVHKTGAAIRAAARRRKRRGIG